MNLTIDTIQIRQDENGRYNLNDLYRASGADQKNRPSKWLRNDKAKDLVGELELEISEPINGLRNSPISIASTGTPATYVCKELVYAYAMWISPSFHLKVIRAYDQLVTNILLKPNVQHEKYWFAKNPHWLPIRELALQGLKNKEIAAKVGVSPGRVGRAIKRMVQVGLIDPVLRVRARFKEGTAIRMLQLPLFTQWGTS